MYFQAVLIQHILSTSVSDTGLMVLLFFSVNNWVMLMFWDFLYFTSD